MSTPRKYSPGDKVRMPASLLNDIMDLTRAAKGNIKTLKTGNDNPAIIRVKNNSGAFCEANTVLSLENREMVEVDASADIPTQNLGKFRAGRFALVAEATVADDRFLCVLISPLRDGEIGRAWIHGIVPVLINVTDAAHETASIAADGVLDSATDGDIIIRYKESGTGDKWALIELNAAAGSGAETIIEGTKLVQAKANGNIGSVTCADILLTTGTSSNPNFTSPGDTASYRYLVSS